MPSAPPPAADRGPALVWFRRDLRLADNPALVRAAGSGRPVAALFVLDESAAAPRPPGGAARWWLHESLAALGAALERHGVPLILARGPSEEAVGAVVRATGAGLVVWNRRYDAAGIAIDRRLKAGLRAAGVAAESFQAGLLHEPWTVTTQGGSFFKVFTPFWRAAQATGAPRAPLPAPDRIDGLAGWSGGDRLENWRLQPTAPDWAAGLRAAWVPGEAAARARLADFVAGDLARYADARDLPDRSSTSRLSPHLAFGEISPFQIRAAALHAAEAGAPPPPHRAVEKFLQEVGWREFSYHLLHQLPDLAVENVQPRFDGFPWRPDAGALEAWRRGRTGIPLVDAGMAELWTTGWMHNRVRMVVASFLTKHLMQDWRSGEAWFWDTLVDADPASNAASWQWVAGSGADAAPYFRVFNPVLQGEKFDAEGGYVRRWLPALAGLPARYLHRPWEAPAAVRRAAGLELGVDYPFPIVDLATGRAQALAAFAELGRDRET